jgi:hypothetical protein
VAVEGAPGPSPARRPGRRDDPTSAALIGTIAATALVAAALVVCFDMVLLARVRAGSDSALRLSVILPYLGVDPTYVLARALGLAALVLAAVDIALGFDLARRVAAGGQPPPAGDLLHRSLGLLVVGLVAAHAAVPYLSAVGPYGGWPTALVPFAQPFSWGTQATVSESLGILALYLFALAGPGYLLVARRDRGWRVLHRLVVVAYALAVFHALFLGSDFYVAGWPRVALIAVQIPVLLALAARLRAPGARARSAGSVLAALAAIVTAALLVVVGLGVAGAPLGGFRL